MVAALGLRLSSSQEMEEATASREKTCSSETPNDTASAPRAGIRCTLVGRLLESCS